MRANTLFRTTRRSLLLSGGLFILIVCEYLLFRSYIVREVAPWFPFAFDQSVYLPAAYQLSLDMRQQGIIHALLSTPPTATAPLFTIQAALFFLMTSATRLNALTINFIYFAWLQVVVFYVAKHYFKRTSIAFIMLGLVLVLRAPFFSAGGIDDFRMDFIALCNYGIFVTCILRSEIFLDRRWSVLAGVCGGLMVMLRAITSIYVVGVFFLLLLAFSVAYLLGSKASAKTRIMNLILCGLLLGCIALPLMWISRDALYHYYVVGHVLNQEKFIRAAEVGITDWYSSLIFYPDSLLGKLGPACKNWLSFLLAIGLLLFIGKQIFGRRSAGNVTSVVSHPANGWPLFFIALAVLVPWTALTLDTSKSIVVASILVIPVIWFVMLVVVSLFNSQRALMTYYWRLIAILLMLTGIYWQVHQYHHHGNKTARLELQEVNRMQLNIGDYALAHHWSKIVISFDAIAPEANSGSLKTIYFEYRHIMLDVENTALGGSIFSISQAQILAALTHGNVITLIDQPSAENSPYPLDKERMQMRSFINAFISSHPYHLLGKYQFFGKTAAVYVEN